MLDLKHSEGNTKTSQEKRYNFAIAPLEPYNVLAVNAIDFLTKTNILFVSDKGNYFLSKYFNAEKKFASLMISQNQLNGMQTGLIQPEVGQINGRKQLNFGMTEKEKNVFLVQVHF